jgi:hypothetical protein
MVLTYHKIVVKKETVKTSNVIGFTRGIDPVRKDNYFIVGAHWDHEG